MKMMLKKLNAVKLRAFTLIEMLVVDSQAELYEMKNNKTASLAALVSEGQITQKQADSYNDYYAKHGGESRSVAN